MNKMITLLLTMVSLASFQAVQAEQWQGFYVDGFAGANFASSHRRNFGGSSSGDGRHAKLDLRTGYVVGGGLGYVFCNGFRVEGEISYRHNQIRRIRFNNLTTTTTSSSSSDNSGRHHGSVWSLAYMANLIYDVDTSCWDCCWGCGEIIPYFGGGIGYAHEKIRLRHRHGDNTDNFLFGRTKRNGFAWQLIAGLGWELSPCSVVSVEYRFFKGRDRHFYNHMIGANLRYDF